jgi:epoxyqueuosine reductase
MPGPRRNCRAVLPWKKARPDAHAVFRSHKDALSRIFQGRSSHGRRSQKAGDYSVDSTTKQLIGRRKLPAPAADANRSIVQLSSASALIVHLSTNCTCILMSLSGAIKQEARALGFDAVGIAHVSDEGTPSVPSNQVPTDRDHSKALVHRRLFDRLTDWLRRGYHGTMAWMERTPDKRADPRHVLPGCRSIISLGINYLTEHRANEQPGYGRIARYAWGADYHKILGARLKQLEQRIASLAPHAQTRSYVDTGPIMEKAWAERAGLGWIGKHSNLVSAEYGSWLLLGEILTTLELEPDEPATDLCGSCTLCIQACPTGAITEPYVVDATRCISYLTIELRGDEAAIPSELQVGMGNKIFGCDDCLDVCPFNLRTEPTQEHVFQPSRVTLSPDLSELSQLDESTFVAVFQRSPIRRAKYQGLLRNVAIARRNLSPSHPLVSPRRNTNSSG